MTCGASVWQFPKGAKPKGLGPVAKLVPLQNKCLRAITGGYKATNTQILEAEAGVIPLDIYLDQAVLRARNAHRCDEIIRSEKGKIRSRLRGRRGRRSQPGDTPMTVKETWAKRIMERRDDNSLRMAQQEDLTPSSNEKNTVRKWAIEKWKKRWKNHLDTVPRSKRTPAHDEILGSQRDKLHQDLRKAESSLAIQLRTGKIGFGALLHARRVPDIISPGLSMWMAASEPQTHNCFLSGPCRQPSKAIRSGGDRSIRWDYVNRKRAPGGGSMGYERRYSGSILACEGTARTSGRQGWEAKGATVITSTNKGIKTFSTGCEVRGAEDFIRKGHTQRYFSWRSVRWGWQQRKGSKQRVRLGYSPAYRVGFPTSEHTEPLD